MWLKRRTPQNIVIGGAAGAFPPLIGWAAVTGSIDLMPLLLFAIIFFWTPPHFWSLSLYAHDDYERAGVPMLPVVAGPRRPGGRSSSTPSCSRSRSMCPWRPGCWASPVRSSTHLPPPWLGAGSCSRRSASCDRPAGRRGRSLTNDAAGPRRVQISPSGLPVRPVRQPLAVDHCRIRWALTMTGPPRCRRPTRPSSAAASGAATSPCCSRCIVLERAVLCDQHGSRCPSVS